MQKTFRCLIATLTITALTIGCSVDARRLRLLTNANDHFASGEYDKAKIEYLSILKDDPGNALAIERLATIWFEQGSPLQAAPFLLALRQISPENLDARTKLVLVFLYAGQFEEARKEAITLLDRSPLDGKAMSLLVESSIRKEHLEDAEERLRTLAATDQPGFNLAMATLSLRKGDAAAAEREVRTALSLDPHSTEAHLALAKLASAKEDFGLAEREFEAAARLAPARSPARIAYAEFKMRAGAIDEAKDLLLKLTREAPDFLTAWRLLAQVALTEKKPDEALTLLDNALLRDPGNIEARLVQSEAWLARGEIKKAIEALENLNTSYPKVLLIKRQLARAYFKDGNLAQAAAVLNHALTDHADNTEASLLLAEIELLRGKARQVANSMLDLLRQRPGLIKAQLILAEAYRSLGRLDEAAKILRQQITNNPKSASAHLLLGMVLRQQNKLDEARTALETAHQLEPKNLLAVAQLVDLEIQLKEYESASRRANEQIEKAPDSSVGYFLEGKVYAARTKSDEAEVALLRALDRDQANSDASDLLVATYLAANKVPEAIALLERVASSQPENTKTLMMMAMLYEKIENFSRAREVYEKLILMAPESALALNNLAYLYAEHFGLLDNAERLAQKARSLEPGNPGIADTMGWILYKRGDYQKALDLLEESASQLSENPEVNFHLGMARYMMGDKEGAKNALLSAATAAKDFRGKDEAQRRLSLLEDVDGKAINLSTQELEAAVKRQSGDPLMRMRLGESYEKRGAFFEAASAYEEAVNLNPNLLTAAVKLAELNSGPLKSHEKALEFAKRARELAPDDPKVLAILGRAAYQNNFFSWSYSLLQQAARQLPNDPRILSDLAWAAYSQGKIDEAREVMQRVFELTRSDDAELFLTMTTVNETNSNLAARQEDIARVLAATPDYVPALVARARYLAESSDLEGAATAYADVLRRYPDFVPAQKDLAALYLQLPGKREEAYDLATKARQALPEDPKLAQVLGRLSFERNDFAYAVQLLLQSAKKIPLDPDALYCLGMSQLKTKEAIQSRETLAQALSNGLQEPLASEARQAINALDQR